MVRGDWTVVRHSRGWMLIDSSQVIALIGTSEQVTRVLLGLGAVHMAWPHGPCGGPCRMGGMAWYGMGRMA